MEESTVGLCVCSNHWIEIFPYITDVKVMKFHVKILLNVIYVKFHKEAALTLK